MVDLTVFCPFTRPWAVAPFFGALAASDVPMAEAVFVAYVDSADQRLTDAVGKAARALPFRSVAVHVSGVNPLPDMVGPIRRRARHAAMREASKRFISDGRLLLLEDDTLIPTDAYARLSETLDRCDWAIGAEVGRWGCSRPPGVWRIVRQGDVLVQKEAVMPSGRDTETVDATGFYCVLTSAAVYREMDCRTWSEVIGYDVHVTYRLTQAGRRLMVDWRVPCVHLTERARLTMADAEPLTMPLAGWAAAMRTLRE